MRRIILGNSIKGNATVYLGCFTQTLINHLDIIHIGVFANGTVFGMPRIMMRPEMQNDISIIWIIVNSDNCNRNRKALQHTQYVTEVALYLWSIDFKDAAQ